MAKKAITLEHPFGQNLVEVGVVPLTGASEYQGSWNNITPTAIHTLFHMRCVEHALN
jgi:hypothetical protein